MNKNEVYNFLSNILDSNLDNPIKIDNPFFLSTIFWNENFVADYSEKYEATVDFFKLHFQKYFDEIIVVTSLYIDYKKLKYKTLEYNLSSKGYILPILENVFDDNLENINDSIFSEISSSFRCFKNCQYQDILDLSFLMMGSDILPEDSGYLFFILPKHNLIIYPHSDIGYGAFCLSLFTETSLWTEFEKGSKEKFKLIKRKL
ncbi:hypothetical protein FW781_21655 [Chryseobacterium panacisoli]|uniref:Uncharacterized protein n=1 Tax=Chryseobacterium panacisoli TaxID=1807141 RepID=A0A5D8ZCR7_9FLAO|nr:hypothetical protein [Chryseobacterium panacisoli]TZF92346.1 hypothetical protein FW781_21655 [Chryseobacterium panacisoli]